MAGTAVEVGFTDKLENPLLFAPEYFPSKIGGHPAWLNPSNLPLVPTCPYCTDPLIFFAQIYAGWSLVHLVNVQFSHWLASDPLVIN